MFSFATTRSEGTSQAARNMVELAAIEVVGKLTRLPYWQCLGMRDDEPEVQRETEDWFLAMDEGAIDHSRYGWGAEEWTHDSHIVVEETTKRAMAVSFTSGTNWSNANLPTITPDEPAAAQELDVVAEDLAAGAARSGALPRIDLQAPIVGRTLPGHRGLITKQSLVAVVAARVLSRGADHDVLDLESVVDLTGDVVDDALAWTAPAEGDWRLLTYWQHGTGQTANPSASVNYTVNYIDRDGGLFWYDVRLPNAQALVDRLKKVSTRDPQPEVQIRGDLAANYDSVGKVIYACQRAGITKVAFITEPPARGN
mgnify:CR=1 FL=1